MTQPLPSTKLRTFGERCPACIKSRSARVLLALFVMAAAAQSAQTDEVAPEVLAAQRERIEAMAKAIPAAVAVFSHDGNGGGSGVVISSDGFALSNFHVTAPVGDYMKCGMADGRLYDAVIVGVDPTGDVALIKLFGRDDFPVAEFADSDRVRVGDWCFAVGNPFLLATDFQPTVTYGIVSGVHRYQYPSGSLLEYADCIQTDASINPGNSGGPLFNAAGQLIGINGRGSFEKRGRVNVGLGYAISINQIKNFLGYLRSGRVVDHATLGATVDADETGRVVVSNILGSSNAFRRGLRYGDHVVSFGGRRIGSVNGFKNALGIYPKGWQVPLSFLRDGIRHDIHVRLDGVHAREELLALIHRQAPQPPGAPDEPQPGQPPRRRPTSPPKPQPDVKMPDLIAQHFQQRNGYANYYFNLLHRRRVWDAFNARASFRDASGVWHLVGEATGARPFTLMLDNEVSTGVFSDGRVTVSGDRDLSEELGPRGSGGLLAALHLWRRLLVVGPQQFGDVYYLGTAPLVGRKGSFDVLVGTHDVVESRFVFDPETGQLVAMEMFPDTGVDPCEVYFSEYAEVGGQLIPHHMLIRHGGRIFAELQIQEIELAPAPRDAT